MIYVYIHIYAYENINIYVHIYAYVNIHMYDICVYAYIYICAFVMYNVLCQYKDTEGNNLLLL